MLKYTRFLIYVIMFGGALIVLINCSDSEDKQAARDTAPSFGEKTKDALGTAANRTSEQVDKFGQAMSEKADSASDKATETASSAVGQVRESTGDLARATGEKTSDLGSSIGGRTESAKEAIGELSSQTADRAEQLASAATESASTAAGGVTDSAKEMGGSALDKMESSGEIASNAASDSVDELKDAAAGTGTADSAPGSMSNAPSSTVAETEQARKDTAAGAVDQAAFVPQETFSGSGSSNILGGIVFFYDSSELTDDSKLILDNVAEKLRTQSSQDIEIAGYTDSKGSLEYNLRLSEQRAIAVKDYLAARGVTNVNLTARGYGPENPIADNSTSEGRRSNRRVELITK